VSTVCLAAYLLGKNPRLRIIVLAYNDTFAAALCERIRDLMKTSWYRRAFDTRIKDGHSRANDFETDAGGGVFAAAATGAITGRPADFIIYDDPHEIGDWNNDRKLEQVWANFNTVISRLGDRVDGRVLVVAHRVSEKDLSAHLLTEKGWKSTRLPLIAVKPRKYRLGHREWHRTTGNVLRPHAYPEEEIERLKRTQFSPPFELFYQQGLCSRATQKIKAEHFQSFGQFQFLPEPVVLSIDPGHSGAPKGSRSVIQVWKYHDRNYYLVDQFCDHCDLNELRSAFWSLFRRHSPSVALIEDAANGAALHSVVQKKARCTLRLITPRRVSKAERLHDHLPKIRARRIYLPEAAVWRDAFVDEVVNFPSEFDDQVDAMTQYLDFMDGNPTILPPPQRATGVSVRARLFTSVASRATNPSNFFRNPQSLSRRSSGRIIATTSSKK
jgi:predicted phage terminase large subunit-like protein